MAQRKSAPSASAKSGGPARPKPGGPSKAKPGGPSKASPARPGTASKAAATKSAARPPANPPVKPPVKNKPGKSIVNQKQTPWALITTTVLIVLFAAGIVTYAVASHKSPKKAVTAYTRAEIPDAKRISGLIYKAEPNHNHVAGVLKYDSAPPIGGDHSGYWADCTGTVYAQAIANENAVHMLEHGAVWITYKPGLAADQLNVLKQLVTGQNYMALSPYPGLKTNISLQSWDYQLFVDKASDARIQQFIATLRHNPKTTPEVGASCAQAPFKSHPSTFGKPLSGPAA